MAFAAHEERLRTGRIESMPVKAHIIFDIFPFAILLDTELKITVVGAALRRILFRVLGTCIDKIIREVVAICSGSLFIH